MYQKCNILYRSENENIHGEVQAETSFQILESKRALDKFFPSVAVAVYIQSLSRSKLWKLALWNLQESLSKLQWLIPKRIPGFLSFGQACHCCLKVFMGGNPLQSERVWTSQATPSD